MAVYIPLLFAFLVSAGVDAYFWPEKELKFLGNIYTPASSVIALVSLWPVYATSIRRLHDLNISGWWVVTNIPLTVWLPDFSNAFELPPLELGMVAAWMAATLIAVLLGLRQMFERGVPGENRFGPDPLSK